MKKFVLIATFSIAAFATAQTAAAPSMTGKWTVHASLGGNENDSECTFTQTGMDLAGTCSGGEGPAMKFTGKMDGTKVSWSAAGDYNGTPLTMKYVGLLASGKVTGTLTVDPFGVEGDFTATPAK